MKKLMPVAVMLLPLLGCGGGGGESTPSAPSAPVAAPTPTPTPAPTPTPTAFNVSGVWRSEARSWVIELHQDQGAITGVLRGFKNVTYDNLSDPDLQIKGTITSSGQVDFGCKAFNLGFEGTIESSNARMTGKLFDCAGSCRSYGEVLVKQ